MIDGPFTLEVNSDTARAALEMWLNSQVFEAGYNSTRRRTIVKEWSWETDGSLSITMEQVSDVDSRA